MQKIEWLETIKKHGKRIHTEQTFEEAIESDLLEFVGYVKGHSTDFEVQ